MSVLPNYVTFALTYPLALAVYQLCALLYANGRSGAICGSYLIRCSVACLIWKKEVWLWSGCMNDSLFPTLKLALPTKSDRPGFGAKVGALLRIKRLARRHTDPRPADDPHAPDHWQQQDHASLNLPVPHTFSNSPSPAASPSQPLPPLPPQTPMFSSAPHSSPNPAAMASHTPPSKANLKAWWNHFNFVQKTKKEAFEGPYRGGPSHHSQAQ